MKYQTLIVLALLLEPSAASQKHTQRLSDKLRDLAAKQPETAVLEHKLQKMITLEPEMNETMEKINDLTNMPKISTVHRSHGKYTENNSKLGEAVKELKKVHVKQAEQDAKKAQKQDSDSSDSDADTDDCNTKGLVQKTPKQLQKKAKKQLGKKGMIDQQPEKIETQDNTTDGLLEAARKEVQSKKKSNPAAESDEGASETAAKPLEDDKSQEKVEKKLPAIDKATGKNIEDIPKDTTTKVSKVMDDEDELTSDMKNEITKKVIKDQMRETQETAANEQMRQLHGNGMSGPNEQIQKKDLVSELTKKGLRDNGEFDMGQKAKQYQEEVEEEVKEEIKEETENAKKKVKNLVINEEEDKGGLVDTVANILAEHTNHQKLKVENRAKIESSIGLKTASFEAAGQATRDALEAGIKTTKSQTPLESKSQLRARAALMD